MKKTEDINELIRTAVSNSVPDILDSILSDCEKEQKGNVVNMNDKLKQKRRRMRSIGSLVAVLAIVLVSITGYNLYGARSVDSVISFDINPSLEVKVNKNEKVLEVNPLNEDGKTVIGDMDFKGTDLEMAVNALIGSMLKNGYIDEISNSILVSVENDNEAKSAELQTKLSQEISKLLQAYSIEGAILSQSISDDDDLENLAKENNITRGKAQVINQLVRSNQNYQFKDLAKLSINDLNLLVESKSLKLENTSQVGKSSDKAYIGADNAINIALGHASVNISSVKDLDVDMEYDDGRFYYEVEFETAGMEYEYDIDAVTGAILSFERDRDDDYDYDDDYDDDVGYRPPTTSTAGNMGNGTNHGSQPTSGKSNDSGKTYIGAQNAVNKALAHAGLSASSIKDLDVELEHDDGRVYYEIDFEAGNMEYEYDIDAYSGAILSFEKERDDD